MDANKFKVLQDANYTIAPTCEVCIHSEIRPDGWGRCKRLPYEHGKHTASDRLASIHRSGRCDHGVLSAGRAVDLVGAIAFDSFIRCHGHFAVESGVFLYPWRVRAEDAERALEESKKELERLYQSEIDETRKLLKAACDERDEARKTLAESSKAYDSPVTSDFIEGIRNEAAHQVTRFGADHDSGKDAQDWFWLLGWLSGKAVHAAEQGDTDKLLHHIVSSGAMLLNWYAHAAGDRSLFRPGTDRVHESSCKGGPGCREAAQRKAQEGDTP